MYLIIALLAVRYVAAQGLFNLNANECHFYQEFFETGFTQTQATNTFQWISSVTAPITIPGAPDNPCRRQGVLRVTPTAANNQIRVRFGLYDVTGWSMHVGDSNTNNGWGGDSGTSNGWSAEVHSSNKAMVLYENVATQLAPPVPRSALHSYFETCPVVWDMNITKNKNPNADYPTDINMITDPYIKGTDYSTNGRTYRFDDIYIGINRVISGPGSRIGSGACILCVNLN